MMKRPTLSLALCLASLAAAPLASAATLTFDGILADGSVDAHYGGLDWSRGDWFAFSEPQDPFTAHSGDVRVATGFGDSDAATAIGLGDGRTFQGAWFAGYEDVTVTFKLYDQGRLVATSATLATSVAPAWLASGYTGLVDEVVVSSGAQGGFVMDDFTFAPAVPEPHAAALMAAGLLTLAATALRRRA
jgi:hypothetical protein